MMQEQMTIPFPLEPRRKPDLELKTTFGLLSPEGKLYACNYCEHDQTYDDIRADQDLKAWTYNAAKFLHLSGGHWNDPAGYFTPTQRQIDTLFDWVQKDPENRKLPKWLGASQ